MENIPPIVMWYVLAAIVVLAADSLAIRWVHKGKPDPFHDLDQGSVSRRRT